MQQLLNTKFFSYAEYVDLVVDCATKGCTTGPEQSKQRIEATKLNAHRMLRISKQTELDPKLIALVKGISKKWDWVIIAEVWCGDGAQNIPIIAKIAALNRNIDLKIILRDDNDDFMNAYTTEGSRAIPKLICFESGTKNEIGTWGPRPTVISAMVKEFKKNNPAVSHDEFVKNVHLWYAKDKGASIQSDFYSLLNSWNK